MRIVINNRECETGAATVAGLAAEYVKQCEDEGLSDYLLEVWHSMQRSVEAGLNHEGRLPGPLNLQRKAATYYVKAQPCLSHQYWISVRWVRS